MRPGVVVRARRVQGREDDTVIKLRPVVPEDIPEQLRESPDMVVELDAMPGGYVCSASMKGRLGGDVRELRRRREARSASCSPRSSARSTPRTRPRGSSSTTSRCSARSS